MSDKRAYALKESAGDLSSAAATLPDGRSIDIGSRLKNNAGVLVTSDPDEQRVLDGLSLLKEVPVPKQSAKSGGKE